MADQEYKKYDTRSKYTATGIRLAKDAEVRETANGKLVRLTIVDTSRLDSDDDLWVEATVRDFDAGVAEYLRKGDILHEVTGKPTIRRYGDNNEKFTFGVRQAMIHVPAELFAQLKERGWVPGQGGNSKPNGKPAARPSGKQPPKPVNKKSPPVKKPVEEPDDSYADDDLPF